MIIRLNNNHYLFPKYRESKVKNQIKLMMINYIELLVKNYYCKEKKWIYNSWMMKKYKSKNNNNLKNNYQEFGNLKPD